MPAAPILNLKESLENPFLKDRSNIQTLTTNHGVDISLLKTPIHLAEENHKDITAPELGADTDNVLEEAGFTKKKLKSLRVMVLFKLNR